jgi:transposase
MAVDTPGRLLALTITAANGQERAQVSELAKKGQEVTHGTVEIAHANEAHRGDAAAQQAEEEGFKRSVVKQQDAKRGFVLLPRRWAVERSFGRLGRIRRLARDSERLNVTLDGWHWVACMALLLAKVGFKSA